MNIEPHQQQKMKQTQTKNKITFIRHAQSMANKAVHDFREERNLPDCWKVFHSIDDFNHKVIYNPALCDCGISPKGQIQCLEIKQRFKNRKVDLILVSPLERALQTCQKIFEDKFKDTQIIIQPLLAESMKYSSDISRRIQLKQKRFPNYNFAKLIQQGDFWFIKNDNEENQQLYFQHLQAFPHHSYEQKQKQIARFMYLKHLRETNLNLRKRVQKIKELIKSYSEKYKNIVIVSHYYTIKHILAKKLAANGEVLDDFQGPNCSIHEQYLQNLMEKKQN